ncbi:MAG: pseudouridine synthase [Alloprevotella sp.]|nr:rRNA pseudouridine synthase [Bacteroidales bacterium]MDD7564577.1 pseudouridine synthase [Prevotellamassilia sp.]MDY4567446.1 pseudouridine synthase [Alloprevotella sp.]MDY5761567.1 pseudouridine synthase [Alloprevotella sp.]MDY6114549.1 pseudouridine synthase [Alloprevotella sp.]
MSDKDFDFKSPGETGRDGQSSGWRPAGRFAGKSRGGFRPRRDGGFSNDENPRERNYGRTGTPRGERPFDRAGGSRFDGESRGGFGGGNRFGKAKPFGRKPFRNEGGDEGFSRDGAWNYGGERNNYGRGRAAYGGENHYTGTNGARDRKFSKPYNPHAKYSHKKQLEYKEKHYDPNEPVRLNRFLANSGICSRREADKYIASGVVTVNGEVVTELGTKVLRTDTVLFHDQAVKMEKKVYVLLNKPKGYVTTSDDPQNRRTVMDLVTDACRERIYPVGRLDRNTTGVLLLTNDGEIASKLTHPKFLKKKIYHVTLDKAVTAADLRQIAEGINLEDGEVKADAIEYASPDSKKEVGIEIHSGKNRIVRRIFEHLGYNVVKLDRVYFAGLTKKNVKRGDWRYLTEAEVNMLYMS